MQRLNQLQMRNCGVLMEINQRDRGKSGVANRT